MNRAITRDSEFSSGHPACSGAGGAIVWWVVLFVVLVGLGAVPGFTVGDVAADSAEEVTAGPIGGTATPGAHGVDADTNSSADGDDCSGPSTTRRVVSDQNASARGCLLSLNVGVFDPVDGEPDVSERLLTTPEGLTTAGTSTTGYYVVQFDDATDEDVESLGGTVHSFVPDNGVLLSSPLSLAEIREKPFVRAALLYQPAYRLSGDLLDEVEAGDLDDPSATIDLEVRVFENREAVARHVESLASDATATPATSEGYLRVTVPETAVHRVAFVHEVRHVRREPVYRPENDRARVVMGVADPATPTQNRFGLTGEGQVVGIADTGLDNGNPATIHRDFRGRIVETFTISTASLEDKSGHGTHVAGSLLGNGSAANATIGTPQPRGVAHEAGLVFQATRNHTTDKFWLPTDLGDLFEQARGEGARVHSNSFGSETHNWTYNGDAEEIDTFVRNNTDAIVVFSAGNYGTDWNRNGVVDPESLGPKKTAKNMITVGASENDRPGLQFNADFDYTTNGTNLIWDYNHNEQYDPGELVNGTAPDPGRPLQNITGEDARGGGDDDGDWGRTLITVGNDRYANTTAQGDDIQVVANNSGPWPPWQPVVLPGPNQVIDGPSDANDDRRILADFNFNNTADIDRDGPGNDTNGDGNLTYDPEPFIDEDGPVTWGRFRRFHIRGVSQGRLNVSNGSLGFPVNPIRDDHETDDPGGVTAFSSRGQFVNATTASTTRVKPDLVAPGSWVLSARSSVCVDDGFDPGTDETHAECIGNSLPGLASAPGNASLQPHYSYLSGTSMAAPLAAGVATLVRQSYNDSDALRGIGIEPSAALVKATLINGATDMDGQYGGTNGGALAVPNHHEGWGRVNLSNAIAPGGRFTTLGFVDERTGLLTDDGDEVTYTNVRFSSTRPVDVTLVWTDEPAAAGTTGNQIVNDLDLIVTAPDGTEYRGNVFARNGTSLPDPTTRDAKANNVEKVVLPDPQDGRYEITVRATDINPGSASQPFALVASGIAGVDPINDSRDIRRNLTFVEEAVFPRAIGQPNGTTVDVHVVEHGEIAASELASGSPQSLAGATVNTTTVTTDANGTINLESFGNGLEPSNPPVDAAHPVWNAPSNYVYDDQRRLGNGRYNLLVDVGRDGSFNRSTDALGRGDEPGFRVAAASAADGNESVRAVFDDESVYFTAAGLPAGRTLSAYVVPFDPGREWENVSGLSLASIAANVSGNPTDVTTDSNGTIDHELLWDDPSPEVVKAADQRFTLVLDADGNDQFDAGVDVVDVVSVGTIGTALPLSKTNGAAGPAVVELKAFLNKYASADLDLQNDSFDGPTEQAVLDYTAQHPDLAEVYYVDRPQFEAIREDAGTSIRFERPNVTFSNLTAAPTRAVVDENVTVTAVVTENDGHLGGYNATLTVDGANEMTRTNAIGANEVTTVSFNTSFATTGNHTVGIENLPPITIQVFKPVPNDRDITEPGQYLQTEDFASELVIREGITYEGGGHRVGAVRVEGGNSGVSGVTVKDVVATPGSSCIEQSFAPQYACEAGVRYETVVDGTIEGVTVRGDGTEATRGVVFVGAAGLTTDNVTVTRSRLLGNGTGTALDDIGIDLADGTDNVVTETTIDGYTTGVLVGGGASTPLVTNNTIDATDETTWGQPTGIHVQNRTGDGPDVSVIGNELTDASVGIQAGPADEIRNNHVFGNDLGIRSVGDGNLIADNNVSANFGSGGEGSCEGVVAGGTIYVYGDDTRLVNNTVTENDGVGIGLADGTSNNTVRNNTVSDNNLGIEGCGFRNNSFANNTVSSNTQAGLSIASNHDTLVTDTRATNNTGTGIAVRGAFASTNVTIRDSNVSNNDGKGIRVDNLTDGTVTENNVSDSAEAGIHVELSRRTTVRDNAIARNGEGIVTFRNRDNTLTNNTVRNNTGAGIRLRRTRSNTGGTNATVTDSEVSHNGEGIVVQGANATTIRNNDVIENDGHGIALNVSGAFGPPSDDNVLVGNNVSNNSVGIRLVGASNSSLRNNDVTHNDDHGVSLTFSSGDEIIDSDNNTLADNSVTHNDGDGVHVNSASGTTIDDNTVRHNAKGINFVAAGQKNTVVANLIENSSGDGLVFATVSGTVANNTVRNSGGTGITLWRSASANDVDNNLVERNARGILLTGASNSNVLANDTVIDNDGVGIRIDGFSSDNDIVDATLANNDPEFDSVNAFDNRIVTSAFNDTEVDVVYEGDVGVDWATAPAPDPPAAGNISRFLEVTNDTAAWANVTVHYSDADVDDANEENLRLWRYNGSDWAKASPSGVDTNANEVFGNVTSFGVIAPLWEFPTAPFVHVDPVSHDYGGVSIHPGGRANKTFTISNAGQAPLNVGNPTLTGLASDPDFFITSSGPPTVLEQGEQTTVVVEFVPEDLGDHSATLNIPNNDSDRAVPLSGTGVTNPPPVPAFDWQPSNPLVNETVTFNATNSTDPDGSIDTFEWDLDGNGTVDATGAVVNWSYQNPGNVTVTLTVTDNFGAVNVTNRTVPVSENLSVADYANETGVVQVSGLLDAIDHWRGDRIDTLLLLDVIDAWRSGKPVT